MADQNPNQDRQDNNPEIPGDTNAADIVDRTGEQMPRQSHDGLEAEDRERNANSTRADDDHDPLLGDPRSGSNSDQRR